MSLEKLTSGMTNPGEVLKKMQEMKSSTIKKFLFVAIFIAIFGIVWYVKIQINKKDDNDADMEMVYNDLPISLGPIHKDDARFTTSKTGTSKGLLRDYFISSSYNSCCAGDFVNSYVSINPLKEVLAQGVRVLDFALYSINGKIVVGAGDTDSDNIKGTYNALPLNGDEGVFDTINSYAFSHPCPNPTDPLFLNFRIKSTVRPNNFYRQLTEHVKNSFGGRTLSPEYGFEGRHNKSGGINLIREPILNLKNKVIIMCYQDSNNFRGTDFEELVNIASSGSPFLKSKKDYDIRFTHDALVLTDFNKKNMTISMPDLSALTDNMGAGLHMKYGCQMILMNWSNYDSNMEFYRQTFIDEGSAFVLKPEDKRYKLVTVETPPPQDPNVSYAKKPIDLPMYKKHI